MTSPHDGDRDAAAGDDSDGEQGATSNWALPRWAIFAMIPGVAAPLLILGFILRMEYAHDEERCPFTPVDTRTLDATVAVREEARTCLPDVEERRYLVQRGGRSELIGSRRFAPAAFGPGYRWRAQLSEGGEVSVYITNPGHAERMYREGTPEDEAAWQAK